MLREVSQNSLRQCCDTCDSWCSRLGGRWHRRPCRPVVAARSGSPLGTRHRPRTPWLRQRLQRRPLGYRERIAQLRPRPLSVAHRWRWGFSAAEDRRVSSTTCPNCGGAKKEWSRICWRCYVDQRCAEARREGYAVGFRDAEAQYRRTQMSTERVGEVTLDERRLRQLLQLCHPDRHANSLASQKATAWLLSLRQERTRRNV